MTARDHRRSSIRKFRAAHKISKHATGKLPMDRLLRSVLGIRPGTVARYAFNATSVFCTFTLVWEHIVTIQLSEGPSMYPTFNPRGDWLLISRIHNHGKGIQIGDVVRFNHPTFLGTHGAKRVVGMPGDFVCHDEALSTEVGKHQRIIQVGFCRTSSLRADC